MYCVCTTGKFPIFFFISELNSFQENKWLSYIFSHSDYSAVNCITARQFLFYKAAVFPWQIYLFYVLCGHCSVGFDCAIALSQLRISSFLLASQKNSQSCNRWFLWNAGFPAHAILAFGLTNRILHTTSDLQELNKLASFCVSIACRPGL